MAKRRGPTGPFFDELRINEWFRLRDNGEALIKSGHSSAQHRGFIGCYWRGSTKISGKTPVILMAQAEIDAHLAASPPYGKGELHPSEVKHHAAAPAEPAFNPYRQRPPGKAAAGPAGNAGKVPPGPAPRGRGRGPRPAGPQAEGKAPR